MSNQSTSKSKKSLASVKTLLAAVGITSTLGLWSLFSTQDLKTNGAPQDALSNYLSGLKPLPTLVNGVQAPANARQSNSQAGSDAPSVIYMGGARPGAQSNIITTTRSSR